MILTNQFFTTNSILQVIIPIITNGLKALPQYFPLLPVVKQMYQPTMQGVNSGPTVYLYEIGNHPYGFPIHYNNYDSDDDVMQHVEEQVYEKTFQVNAWVIQTPTLDKNNIGYTASDLVTAVKLIMGSSKTVDILLQNGMSILRIMTQLNPQFIDDRDFYEQSPSFDFTLTYTQRIVTTDPVISSVDYELNPI